MSPVPDDALAAARAYLDATLAGDRLQLARLLLPTQLAQWRQVLLHGAEHFGQSGAKPPWWGEIGGLEGMRASTPHRLFDLVMADGLEGLVLHDMTFDPDEATLDAPDLVSLPYSFVAESGGERKPVSTRLRLHHARGAWYVLMRDNPSIEGLRQAIADAEEYDDPWPAHPLAVDLAPANEGPVRS